VVAVDRAQRASGSDDAWARGGAPRFAVVDQFEADGARYVVLREIDADPRMPHGGPLGALTPRERQIALFALAGHHNKLIAHELGIAVSTVRVLLSRAAERLGTRGRKELLDLLART
jgi:DNA-binding CsgD family transcriptional regulator